MLNEPSFDSNAQRRAVRMTTYDPDKHVTAAELRNQGIPIPEQIPAEAFVPRDGYRAFKLWAPLKETGDTGPKGPDAACQDVELPPRQEASLLKLRVVFRQPFQLDGSVYLVDPAGNIRLKKED